MARPSAPAGNGDLLLILDDFTPEAAEKLHYDHKRTPPKAG